MNHKRSMYEEMNLYLELLLNVDRCIVHCFMWTNPNLYVSHI